MLLLKSSWFLIRFFAAEDQGSIPNYSYNFLFTVSFEDYFLHYETISGS